MALLMSSSMYWDWYVKISMYGGSWRGEKAVEELHAAGIPLETFQVLIDCSNKVISCSSLVLINDINFRSVM